MARPQSPDYDKRRDAIVAAATHLYARQGFQGASVADLAKACATSKSLIYHYFPSKEDILYEVMAAHLEALVDAPPRLWPLLDYSVRRQWAPREPVSNGLLGRVLGPARG